MFSLFKPSNPSPNSGQHAKPEPPSATAGNRVAQAISRSFKGLGQLFTGQGSPTDRADNAFFEALEESLLLADMGLDTAVMLVDNVRRCKPEHKQQALNFFTKECKALLSAASKHQGLHTAHPTATSPLIILLMGINGAGKTTTIGKLAHQFVQQGHRVTIGAGDTFRAAAEDQLEVWAKRAGATFIQNPSGDAAAVMHDAITSALERGDSVVLLDTAGRLHNQTNLMAELKKMDAVINKVAPALAQRHNLLVLDATTGQNGLKQAEVFHQSIPVTGVVLTKLDGTAKGGIALSIAHEHQFPIELVGVGEAIGDLQPFNPQDYLAGLTGNLQA